MLARIKFIRCLMSLTLVAAGSAFGTNLVYTPINPTFGGNPLNASGLQANASAQNQLNAPTPAQPSALDKFTAAVQNAILTRLESGTISGLFDSNGNLVKNGTVALGNFTISISPAANGQLQIVTSDMTTGQSTTINIGTLGN
jgi:curli production assembly/transport component CsgF